LKIHSFAHFHILPFTWYHFCKPLVQIYYLMKPLLFTLSVIFLNITGYSQQLHLNFFAGIANYQGDLQTKRITFNQARQALGAGLSYEICSKVFIRSQFTYARIGAQDQNGKNAARNLDFTSTIFEGQLAAEYYLRDLDLYTISPYLFAGVAVFHHNPFTHDLNGQKIYLKPLSTEGQGFYPGRKEYSLTQFAIPFGGGLKMALSDNVRVGLEFGLRKLFTDYLDDVSANYVDQNLLLANRGQTAVDLAYRGDELKNGPGYPADGEIRGGPKYKDWYYITSLNFSFRLGNGNGGGGRSKTGCPTKVY